MELEKEEVVKTNVHMGHNVMKFRQLKGLKQSAFAPMIGLNTQQDVSRLERKAVIDVKMLQLIAPLLGVSMEVLQTMPEDASSVVIENNTFESGSIANISNSENDNFSNTYYPIDQIVDLIKEKDRKEQERMEAMERRIMELEELIRRGMK